MNAQRIVSALTVALGVFLLQPIESFATNTPGADCVGHQACQTNSNNTTLQQQQQQAQGQTQASHSQSHGGDANVSSYIAPHTSLATGGYVYNNRTLSITPVQAIAPAVVAPSAFVAAVVDPTCGPRQVIQTQDVHGTIIGVFSDTQVKLGEDMWLEPAEVPYRTVEVMPGLKQLIGHKVRETTAVVTTSASGAFAFGANGNGGAGGSIGGASGGAMQRMVTTIRLQECVYGTIDERPKAITPPAPKKRPVARSKASQEHPARKPNC